jgi:hypothetical protein
LLASNISAVPPVRSALAELFGMPEEVVVEVLVDDPVELLFRLDEEPVDAFEELDELEVLEVGEGVFGEKLSFPVPNPTFDA